MCVYKNIYIYRLGYLGTLNHVAGSDTRSAAVHAMTESWTVQAKFRGSWVRFRVPKAIYYLLKGDYRVEGLGLPRELLVLMWGLKCGRVVGDHLV